MEFEMRLFSATLLIVMFAVVTAHAQTDYIGGDATAIRITEPGLEGYWKYCVTINWDTSQYSEGARGQSHVSIVLGLEECLGYCGDACFMFPDTVGVSDGVDGCEVYYYAEFNIGGDPTLPPTTTTVKFEPYPADCEPDVSGTASVCFYSMFPPRIADSNPGSLWIKFGQFVEEGLITGMLPSCRTAATEESSWGSIKRLFR
ncbi:hypothetical protein ACFL2Z_03420 [Candidatus Eisenbacteria bacterium]|uniref:Uncharacterized protein n=1 Tax=Eiseniibacteriota bacterium TaxID=2212470 RepID=A0ABV6YPW0_UNCEI